MIERKKRTKNHSSVVRVREMKVEELVVDEEEV